MSRGPLRFVLTTAWRDTRGAGGHVLAFVACVVVGVAALATVGTLAADFERGLAREARTLLGGDVEVRASRPLPAPLAAEVERLAADGAAVVAMQEMVGMARDPVSGRTALVELKAVDRQYPLYGALETVPPGAGALIADGSGVLVGEDLLAQLALRVGDRIGLGDAALTVRGVIAREPERPATLLSLGPRMLLSLEALEESDLVGFGSRVRYRTLLRLPADLTPSAARERLLGAGDDPGVRVTTFDQAQPGLRRTFEQVTAYLGLVGVASLLVGGIGVATAVTALLRRRVLSLAILKVTGATSGVLVATYLVQTVGLAVLASGIGVLIGLVARPALLATVRGLLPFELAGGLDPRAVAAAAAMGIGTTVLCALWPLLRIRAVRPSLLLRSEVDPVLPGARRPWLAAAPIAAGLIALAVWQAGSLRIGLVFVGASAVALVVFTALGRAVGLLARVSPPAAGPALRHGLANLRRPGAARPAVVIALGVAAMLLTTVALLERGLSRAIDHDRRREAPSFFFIDIQADQADAFARVVRETGGPAPALTPVVRARLAAIEGESVTRELAARRAPSGDRTGYFTREYVVTLAATPPDGNALVRGRWWTEVEAAQAPRVSIEEEAARVLGVDVGSRLTFDVLGVAVETEVMSVRRVDWHTLGTNFFMVLSPGALDGAPMTYVATARVTAGAERRVQDAVVAAFPNVTAVPVRDVLERVASILDRLARAVRLLGGFALMSGLAVAAVALAGTRAERRYEAVILRTLGATRAVVARAFAVEYACLGAAAALGGSVLATALSWIVLRWILDLPWAFDPLVLLAAVAATTLLAVAVGFAGHFRALGARPLALLRRE